MQVSEHGETNTGVDRASLSIHKPRQGSWTWPSRWVVKRVRFQCEKPGVINDRQGWIDAVLFIWKGSWLHLFSLNFFKVLSIIFVTIITIMIVCLHSVKSTSGRLWSLSCNLFLLDVRSSISGYLLVLYLCCNGSQLVLTQIYQSTWQVLF